MEIVEDKVKFKISVNRNNDELIKYKKKVYKISAICLMPAMLLLAAAAVFSFISKNKSLLAFGIFAGFAVISLVYSIVFFVLSSKARKYKKSNKYVQYAFHQNYLEIFNIKKQEAGNKIKRAGGFLYRKYDDKQYVSKIIESETRIELKIRTGSHDFVPTYRIEVIPKSIISGDKGKVFIEFLKQKVGQDYKIETKK